MPKGIPIGFQMAEKKRENTNTHTHFRIYICRDTNNQDIFRDIGHTYIKFYVTILDKSSILPGYINFLIIVLVLFL